MPTAFRRAILLATMIVTAAAVACSPGTDSGSESSQKATEPTATTEVPDDSLLSVALDFTLPSANGSPVTLSELSAEQPVVLVFYRAFW